MKTPAPMRTRYRNTPGAEAHTTNGLDKSPPLPTSENAPYPALAEQGRDEGPKLFAPAPAKSLLTP